MRSRHAVLLTAPTADVCLPPVYPEQRRAAPPESTLVEVFIPGDLNLFRINTSWGRLHFAQFWCNASPFRINTCKSVSKQTTLTPFRMNTYEKTGGWGPSLAGYRPGSDVLQCAGSIFHGSRNTVHGTLMLLSRNQQVLRKRPLAVDPLAIAPESRARRHLRNFFGFVFVRTFRPDRFVFVQHEPQTRGGNVYGLTPRGTQMHLDSPFHPVPSRGGLETAPIKVPSHLPADSRQPNNVERS